MVSTHMTVGIVVDAFYSCFIDCVQRYFHFHFLSLTLLPTTLLLLLTLDFAVGPVIVSVFDVFDSLGTHGNSIHMSLDT